MRLACLPVESTVSSARISNGPAVAVAARLLSAVVCLRSGRGLELAGGGVEVGRHELDGSVGVAGEGGLERRPTDMACPAIARPRSACREIGDPTSTRCARASKHSLGRALRDAPSTQRSAPPATVVAAGLFGQLTRPRSAPMATERGCANAHAAKRCQPQACVTTVGGFSR